MIPALAIKTVNQHYAPNPQILHLLQQFREMINHSIQVGLAENVTSLKALSSRTYKELSRFDTMSYYKLCAMSAAAVILQNHRKAVRRGEKNPRTTPRARRLRLTICYGFKIQNGFLLLPHRPKQPIRIALTQHVQASISGYAVRSVTLTTDKLSVAYAKQAVEIRPRGFIGLDRNLDNVTLAATDGSIMRHDLSRATSVKTTYRAIRSHIRRNDVRIRREISGKYGCKQREKVKQILHNASKQIIQHAKQQKFGLVMEQLTGVRRLYRRGNGQGRRIRGRMNSWSFWELQRQIEYKAHWEGLPVIYVYPHGTSAKCSRCGSRMARIPEENRKLKCPTCGVTVDRDVNAARNILARGVRFASIALPIEAMVPEPIACGNPESRWKRVNPIGNPPTS
jgi:putative transposase